MHGNPMNIPPVSIAAAKAALIEQYSDPTLRRRASMLWGTRGVGKSSIVRQVAGHFDIPLVDLRLTTIEPVDIRGAIYADEALAKTVWFPPEFLPTPDQSEGLLFLDELTAADQRLQISAYSLILDRRVGNYHLPDGWQVVAAGNASFHGAISHDMGTALADRMFHFNVQTVIDAFLAHAIAADFAPEVMAYLKIRPDKLDDTQAQLAGDHLIGSSPRGWEDISNVLKSGLSEAAKKLFVQGRIGAANAAEFFGVLREIQAGTDVVRLLAARPGPDTAALLPKTLDGLYGMIYGLLAASQDAAALARAMEIIEQLPDIRGTMPLPIREAQTLAMELFMQRGLDNGLEAAILDSPAYHRYGERRQLESQHA
ncbi:MULTISPECIES: ATPase associated with various cellular activities (AAA) [Rhodopseudomonas]|uniref:ATPase family protein associated with various cellular activities (AAA) n=1 Tax=Rhodopseudomonas palustris TaxID=1076 RepID=A0A0D7F3Z0_RHOPL|nr:MULTISPECIES: ATPase associated with various cellular activities (AAA) [Rhodopseudomonas]KIZ47813.1 ATPase family protein associated with various cellular activities (AAA) [Rhodopseudomonas palustris]MDF3812971.1 ATPase [Rhodopseudomonas sp. BAL398]WOK17490.1 ATPase [Rhodopseudomonas sp. BAL398]